MSSASGDTAVLSSVPGGSTACPMHRALVGNTGMEKTSLLGKTLRGEGAGARRISEQWAGSKGWHGESGLARRPKRRANTCKHSSAALPAQHLPASPARTGTGGH